MDLKHPSTISISDFTYELPPEKIANFPLANRDESKLLIFKNKKIEETTFKNLDSFLASETILVFNTSKVIQARMLFFNAKGQQIEIFCLEPNDTKDDLAIAMAKQKTSRWNCLVGNLKQWKDDFLFHTENDFNLKVRIVEKKENYVVIDFEWQPAELCFAEVLEKKGNMPIPPYLKRQSQEIDQLRYQTVYAQNKGSVAAPTAGLHFTETLLEKLKQKSIDLLTLTLHVGAGTFKPVKSETMEGHDMHSEWIDVDISTIESLINRQAKKIIAVGTTSLRTLESLYWMGVKTIIKKNLSLSDLEIKQWEVYELNSKNISASASLSSLLEWMKENRLSRLICHTQILIAPPYELKITDGIITNFHQPNSTLLLLISAIVGSNWKNIYDYALNNNFRFLSYGDSSLLLK